jgi:hypothetical protein
MKERSLPGFRMAITIASLKVAKHRALCPCTIVHGQQKCNVCWWKVRKHKVMDAIRARECVVGMF